MDYLPLYFTSKYFTLQAMFKPYHAWPFIAFSVRRRRKAFTTAPESRPQAFRCSVDPGARSAGRRVARSGCLTKCRSWDFQHSKRAPLHAAYCPTDRAIGATGIVAGCVRWPRVLGARSSGGRENQFWLGCAPGPPPHCAGAQASGVMASFGSL